MIFIGGAERDAPRSNSSFQRASQIRYLRATQKSFHLLEPAASPCDGSKNFTTPSGARGVCVHRSVIIETDKKIFFLGPSDFSE